MKGYVIEATGISKNTYYKKRIRCSFRKRQFIIRISAKKLSQESTKCNVDTFHVSLIKQTVNVFYIAIKKLPTVQNVCNKMEDRRVAFKHRKRMLNKVLKQIGVKWQKTMDSRRLIV